MKSGTKLTEKAADKMTEKVECYFSTLIYLFSQMGTLKQLEASVNKVTDLLISGTDFAQMRLRVLMHSYNSIPITEATSPLCIHSIAVVVSIGILSFLRRIASRS